MSDTPFVSFGNDELDKARHIGEQEKCPSCGELHDVEYGRDVHTGEQSKTLAFVKCGDKTFLVGLNGKRIF